MSKLQAMKKGGNILSKVIGETIFYVKPGMKFSQIEQFFCHQLDKYSVEASFKKVANYSWATCINVNNGVVHGIPEGKSVSEGDLLSIDGGVFYDGFHTDMAYSFIVGKPLAEVYNNQFLLSGRKALDRAMKVTRTGRRVGDISKAIQNQIETDGFYCVRTLTGHGVGKNLHQEPYIPCVLSCSINNTPLISEGDSLAIEIIYTDTVPNLKTEADGWTIVNKGGKISGLFEKSVYITSSGLVDLTPYFWEENAR
jgi:methionyl aminopeptidase